MDRNFDAVGKRVERYINARSITTDAELRHAFAADISGGPRKLRARLRLKPRVDRLMFHCAAKHADQVLSLVQVKYDAHRLVSHWLGHQIGPR
jgi:hypothetical protein